MFANIKILFVLIFATACSSTWEIQDVDGDGKTILDGDCWDSTAEPVPPKGALNYGLAALDIGPEQIDLPYDGIDQNCDGKDDFDQDGDGRVPDVFVGIQTIGLENTGNLEGGDCWDNPTPPTVDSRAQDYQITSDQIFSGASEDLPYDGIDQNCDGKDDFDQDEDGFVPDDYEGMGTQIELIDVEANAVRVTMTEDSGELPSGDCFDMVPETGTPTDFIPLGEFSEVSPEDVHPNSEDPVYDGIDQKCDGNEYEFDADRDGQNSLFFPNREGDVGTDCIDRTEDEIAEGLLAAAGITSADVYLNASLDPPYDNIDQNCSGDSDFDADGDGHDSSTIAKYDGSLGDDCNDENSEISPSAQDLPLDGIDQNCDNLESCYIDSDNDGYGSQEANYIASESLDCSGEGVSDKSTDCDDSDPQTFPGAAELDAPNACMKDSDDDGYGDMYAVGTNLQAGTDCDDSRNDVNLTAGEYPGDNLDQNCDDFELCFEDFDQDTYGSANIIPIALTGSVDCDDYEQKSSVNTDCDDGSAFHNSDWEDLTEEEQQGRIDIAYLTHPDIAIFEEDSTICYRDIDGDGYGDILAVDTVTAGTDCEDDQEDIYPTAPEKCDGQRNDCLTDVPENEIDNDGDGYVECTIDVDGWDGISITGGDDCDDDPTTGFFTRPDIAIFEADPTICYRDNDEDGFGDFNDIDGVPVGTDCDDGLLNGTTRYPGAEELCDGLDNDCDDNLLLVENDDDGDDYVECTIDADGWDGVSITGGDDCDDDPTTGFFTRPDIATNETDSTICYRDNDEDGFGDITATGDISAGTDCDDGLLNGPTRYPGAEELCDGLDNDCDDKVLLVENDDDGDDYVECTIDVNGWDGSEIKRGDDCDDDPTTGFLTRPDIATNEINPTICYRDNDEDGFGDVTDIGDVPVGTDCDDGDESIYPDAPEICDGQINTCGGSLPSNEIDDDGDDYVECTIDGDGWDGVSITGGDDCDDDPTTGFLTRPDIATNETDPTICYRDNDEDGFGDITDIGGVPVGTDCEDGDDTIYPSAPEICDGLINTCGGSLPTDEIDDDEDGYVECAEHDEGWDGVSITGFEDCNDKDDTIYPTAPEICDGLINTCGGSLPADEIDDDGDHFVECIFHNEGWDGVSSVTGENDCDDGDDTIYPSAPEICDGQVNTCGGSLPVDEIDNDDDNFVECIFHNEGWDGDSNVTAGNDCDDDDDTIYPSAPEICDGQVNTCGGSLPANEIDDDGDDFVECVFHSEGWDGDSNVTAGNDCDDDDDTIYPSAPEICDGQVNTCGGSLPANEIDNDGDNFVECIFHNEGWDGVSSVTGENDCDDGDDTIYPSAPEICDGQVNTCGGSLPSNEIDDDNDGYVECVEHNEGWDGVSITGFADCNDDNDTIYPTAPEICDGLINTCGGSLPANESDVDNDGYVECAQDSGGWDGTAVTGYEDCDDDDDTIYPSAPEVCDGQVNTCGGSLPIDEIDNDGDNYVECVVHNEGWDGVSITGGGDCDDSSIVTFPGAANLDDETACLTDADDDGYAPDNDGGTDCDDDDDTIYPSAPEICDGQVNTCGGSLPSNEIDDDGDDFVECVFHSEGWDGDSNVTAGNDCDDDDDTIYPSAPEICDGLINTCGGSLPANEVDDDSDGYVECDFHNEGWDGDSGVTGDNDCDDGDNTIYPSAPEICDGQVNECGKSLPSNEIDNDSDGYVECTLDSNGWDGSGSKSGDDCDDGDNTIYPSAPEICDGQVNTCGGSLPVNEIDNDNDGYVECTLDSNGWDGSGSKDGDDCDDADDTIYPTAPEICDGLINTCGGSLPTNEVDDDSDGYVECDFHNEGWDGDSGVTGDNDCDDGDNTIYPSAPEICDGQVNECGKSLPSNEIDNDSDGYVECTIDGAGWDGVSITGGDDCDDSSIVTFPGAANLDDETACLTDADDDGYAPDNDGGTDCDDGDNTIYPSAPEICDGQVNTCGGSLPVNEIDNDNDGYVECALDSNGWDGSGSKSGDDCDDADDTIYPTAPEICDGLINTCGGFLPTNEVDDDSDGYVECDFHNEGWDGDPGVTGDNDCDDGDNTIYPTAPEICDGQINTCGGSLPTDEVDDDSDGYVECTLDSNGWDGVGSKSGDDCDDGDNTIYPSAPEICDGLVNTCGGSLPVNESDVDNDGYVECAQDSGGWDGTAVTGYEDCDDGDDTIYPSAPEICDGLVNTCGGSLPVNESDVDNDGYVECAQDSGGWDGTAVTGYEDCDDGDETIYPSAPEICDGQVNECGTSLALNETDNDSDGYVECTIDGAGWDGDTSVVGGDDCDDSSIVTFPGAANLDDETACLTDADDDGYAPIADGGTDCDDSDIDENPDVTWYVDSDGDSYGDPEFSQVCERANGTDVANADDCNDSNPYTHLGSATAELTLECTLDADEDGYAAEETCFRLNMADTGSDGWNSNKIELYVASSLAHTFALSSGGTGNDTYCVSNDNTSLVEFKFQDGNSNDAGEISFDLFENDILIGSGSGVNETGASDTLTWKGSIGFATGSTFYSYVLPAEGDDSDDTDAAVTN